MASSIRELLHEFLRQWHDATYCSPLCDLHQFRQAKASTVSAVHLQICATLRDLMDALELHHPYHAQALRDHFIEGQLVTDTANHLHIAEQTAYKYLAAGIEWIAERLEEQERAARARWARNMRLRLDAPTTNTLFGVDALLVRLVKLLSDDASPWLLALEGMGGIGKTALAHVLLEHMIGLSHYQDFAWVTARPSRLGLGGSILPVRQPALSSEALVDRLAAQLSEDDINIISLVFERKLSWLQQRLQEKPHLIVVDNLESVLDLEILLPILQQLCNPTRFVLTSRMGLSDEPNIQHFRVPLLNEQDAFQLLRNEAQVRELPELHSSSDALLRPIYATVGGNPLALRLVAGLLDTDTIDNVLSDLHEGRGDAVDQLYTYLYRHAYKLLDKPARRIWLSLALVIAPLATVDMLAKVSQQEAQIVRAALRKLNRMNLVDCHGDLTERTYSIHPLTRTFLEKQIGKWDTGDDDASKARPA